MKKRFRKITAVLLAAIMVCAMFCEGVLSSNAAIFDNNVVGTQSRRYNFNSNYYISGNWRDDIISVAYAQNNKTQSDLGYTEYWCADFVCDCASLAGVSGFPISGSCTDLLSKLKSWKGESNWHSYSSGYTPQKGDIVFFSDSSNDDYDCDHVGLIYSDGFNSNGTINTIEGNTSGVSSSCVAVKTRSISYNKNISWLYVRGYYSISGGSNTNYDSYDPDNYRFPTRDIYYTSPVMTGDDVRWVQAVLQKLGYSIAVDGSFGPSSKSVVQSFQSDYGLDVDGSVGPATRQKLYDLWNNKKPVDLGTDFYALIINLPQWKTISCEAGDNVILNREPSPIKAEFIWRFERQSDCSYKIINMANRKVLDVQGASSTSGSNVIVHEDNGGDNQRWFIYGSAGDYRLKAKNTDCVLDVTGFGSADGTNIQMHTRLDSDAQKFAIWQYDYDFNLADLGVSFCAFIINAPIWKPISVARDNNVELKGERAPATANQVWRFEKQWDGSYKIISLSNECCLDVWDNSASSGANVQVHESNNGDNQRWYIFQRDGYYMLRSKNTFCMLDVTGFNSADGTNIQMHDENGTDAQKFSIYQIGNDYPIVSGSVYKEGNDFTAPLLKSSPWITLWNNGEGNLELQSEKSNSNYLWRFKRHTDGTYTISSCFDGKCITLENSSHTNGTNIGLTQNNDTDLQRWYIYNYKNSIIIQSKETGQYFDVNNNESASGTNVWAWDLNGNESQRFSIYRGEECKFKAPTLKSIEVTKGNANIIWSSVYGETNFNVKIWKNQINADEPCFLEKQLESETTSFSVKLPNGDYEALVEARNYFETLSSNYIKFNVSDNEDWDSGITGNCIWTFNKVTGELSITGNGRMDDYSTRSSVPWYKYRTEVKSVSFGSGVENVGNMAFASNSNLSDVTLSDTVTEIGKNSFLSCASLKSISSLEKIKTIGDSAFTYCDELDGLVFSDAIESIGSTAITSTAWYQKQPDGIIYLGKIAYKYKGQCPEEVRIKDGTQSINDSAFINRTTLKSIILPDSITEISRNAFSGCTNLTFVEFPQTLTSIKSCAFRNCTNLKGIVVPKNVTTIEEKALGYYYDKEDIKVEGFKFYGYSNTSAEIYAAENGFTFISLDIEYSVGDTNLDGIITISDVTAIQRHLVEFEPIPDELLKLADTNGDGEINIIDATHLQMYLAEYDGIVLGKQIE